MPSEKKKTGAKKKATAVEQPSIGFYRNVAVTFLVVTVALLGVVAYMSVKKVTIRIVTQPQTVQISALARVGEKADDMPHVPGVTGRVEVELERTFAPTGTEEKEVIATGVVRLINETEKNQPLVATTRLLSPEGVLFRLKEYSTVPAGGELEVDVYADLAGKESEIGPTRFTIPGLAQTLQEKIYAVSDGGMKGGVQAVGVVSLEDIEAAKEELRGAAQEEARLQLVEREGTLQTMGFAGELETISFEVVGAEEQEVSEFTVRAQATVIAALYSSSDVTDLANTRLQEKVASEPVTLTLGNALPEVSVDRYDENGLWVQLSIAHSGLTNVTDDSPAFDVLKFYGKNKEEIDQYVRGIEGVQDVTVRFRPAWSTVAPRVPEHIDVKVISE